MKQNAKTAIIDSFKQLSTQKSIDKITVKELCEHSDINRQSFYNHFTDIMAVFKHIIYEELSMDIAENRTFENWSGGFLATMNYLKNNARMILHVYRSSYWPEASNFFANLSCRLLDDVVEECAGKMGVKLAERDQRFIVNFYCHVFNDLIIDWVSDGMKDEPEELLEMLLKMISGSIPRSVDAFITGNSKKA